jgi:hypothetical protein
MAAILVVVAAIAFAVSPFLTDGFNGFAPDQFPVPQDNPPIQPAGYAFAIWGPIYVWLLIHAVTGLLLRAEDPDWRPVRWPLFASLAVGAAWIPVANVSPAMATLLIWVMLGAALLALFRTTRADRWRLQAPIAVYAGWLTAASCVALALSGAGYGVALSETLWGFVMLAVALILAAGVQVALDRAPEYGMTVIWALVAVAVQNWGASMGMVALAGAGVLVMAALARRAAV